jgi:hypothetical protein
VEAEEGREEEGEKKVKEEGGGEEDGEGSVEGPATTERTACIEVEEDADMAAEPTEIGEADEAAEREGLGGKARRCWQYRRSPGVVR